MTSFLCVLACVAFFVLWLWSYGCNSYLHGSLGYSRDFQLASSQGRLSFLTLPSNTRPGSGFWPQLPFYDPKTLTVDGRSTIPHTYEIIAPNSRQWTRFLTQGSFRQPNLTAFGFSATYGPRAFWIIVPYWFLLLASGASAIMLRLRNLRQFNLLSVLLAMTLLGVVLAMISLLDRSWTGW
jgi:hypothetical protein